MKIFCSVQRIIGLKEKNLVNLAAIIVNLFVNIRVFGEDEGNFYGIK